MPEYADLLRSLTLGTARHPVPEGTREWLELRDAIDPTADEAERLLAVWSVTERLERLTPGQAVAATETTSAPADERKLPGGKLSRGVQLVMQDTYPRILPEVLRLLQEKDLQFPPFLLPELLERIIAVQNESTDLAAAMTEAAGPRGRWLAELNPDWEELTSDFDFGDRWRREATPGGKVSLLKRWRRTEPAAARNAVDKVWDSQSPKNQEALLSGLAINQVAEDLPSLRSKLGPKRKGVRRAIFQLLLSGGEEEALNDAVNLAAAALNEEGKITNLPEGDEAKELMVQYGNLRKKESLKAFLLDLLPPNLLPDLLGKTGTEFWVTLNKKELTLVAQTLLRYAETELDAEFVRFACLTNAANIPAGEAGDLCARLPQETFLELFHSLLDEEKNLLYFGGLPRLLALSREEPWSERITKAFVLQIVRSVKDVYALPHATVRDLQLHWKLAIPLVHRSSFGWLRTQLHAMTERSDGFGKLSAQMLQTTAFRRALWGE